ncbi:hypothetical protein INR49_008598 [Caranx melampygus]|nr:hypothetical protein INR49_008598 [Caranx melampygus]
MATAIYLEHYLDKKKGEIDKLAEEYIANVKNLASEQRVEHLQKIQNAYSKCKEFSDDKVQLAMQTYEMVDKHIRRLDADLARFENELKEKLEVSGYESTDGRALKKKRGSRGRGRKGSDEDSPRKKKMKNSVPLSGFTLLVSILPQNPKENGFVQDAPKTGRKNEISYFQKHLTNNKTCDIFECIMVLMFLIIQFVQVFIGVHVERGQTVLQAETLHVITQDDILIDSAIDLEVPAHKTSGFVTYVYPSPADPTLRFLKVTIPIHGRYHEPSSVGEPFTSVDIQPPELLVQTDKCMQLNNLEPHTVVRPGAAHLFWCPLQQ